MAAAFIPFLLMGAQALSGALANRSKKSTTTQDTKQTQTMSGSSMPQYDEAQLDVRNFLLRELMGNVEAVPGYEAGYRAQGISNINKGADRTSEQIRQTMMGRGLGRTSAGISPEIANENARFGQLSTFENQVPLQMEEMKRARMNDFAKFFSSLPVGTTQNQTSTSTGNMQGTSTQPGNMLAGGLGGLSQMGAFLYGQDAFGSGNKSAAGNGTIPGLPVNSNPTNWDWLNPNASYQPQFGVRSGGYGVVD